MDMAAPHDVAGTGPRGPLVGLRVLDLSRVLAGPYATMLLGDLGAEVVKVERPAVGDDTRHWGPPFVRGTGAPEATYFLAINRNKRSVVLDLKSPEDRPFLEALVTWADVLVENFRPGVMDRLGLDDLALEALNPRLVRLSISGFGDDGPERDRVGYDQILQGEGGIMSLTGPETGPPSRVGVPVADLSAGLFGVIGVLGALLERNTGGLGQRVSTSLLAGQIGLHTFQGARYLVAGEVPGLAGNQHPTVAPYGVFMAADAPVVLAVGNDAIWRRFAPLVGLDPEQPCYQSNAERLRHRHELEGEINTRMAACSAAEWLARFSEHGVPAGEVRTLDRVYANPQVRQQGLVWEVDHTTLGPIELPGNPLRYSRSGLPAPLPPPTLGQHTEEVRAAVLTAQRQR